MQECGEKQGKGRATANEDVQCRCKTAADTTPKICSIYSIYLYMEVYSHA